MITVLILGKGSYENYKDIGLASRAFGANSVVFTTRTNKRLIRYFKSVNRKWGGKFEVSFERDWKKMIEEKKNYKKVLLIMDGAPINKIIYRLRTYKNILLIASLQNIRKGAKDISDFRVSVTTQPHSTISAIAVFLHMFYSGRELAVRFNNARYKIKQAKV